MNKPLMYSGIHAVESLLRHRPEGVLELFVLDTRAKRGDARLETLIIAARDQLRRLVMGRRRRNVALHQSVGKALLKTMAISVISLSSESRA